MSKRRLASARRSRISNETPYYPGLPAGKSSDKAMSELDAEYKRAYDEKAMIRLDEVFDAPKGLEGKENPDQYMATLARDAYSIDTDYQKEFILKSLHRMLMRGIPITEIARVFNVNRATIWRWKKELNLRFAEEADAVQFSSFVGETLAFYESMVEESLRVKEKTASTKEKLNALQTALQARDSLNRFLDASGFFDTNKFTGNRKRDKSLEDADKLQKFTSELLNFGDDEYDADFEVEDGEKTVQSKKK